MITVSNLDAFFGPVCVLSNLNFEVRPGQVLAIVGRNGAGKTTLLRTLVGLHRNHSGRITLDGRSIEGLPAHQRARLGIAYASQERGLFPGLSVAENLRIGQSRSSGNGENGLDNLETYFPSVRIAGNQRAETLSGGEQQIVTFVRTLDRAKKVLLLDEPSQGVQPTLAARIAELVVVAARKRGVVVILVEQNLSFARSVADWWLLLERGACMASGAGRNGWHALMEQTSILPL